MAIGPIGLDTTIEYSMGSYDSVPFSLCFAPEPFKFEKM